MSRVSSYMRNNRHPLNVVWGGYKIVLTADGGPPRSPGLRAPGAAHDRWRHPRAPLFPSRLHIPWRPIYHILDSLCSGDIAQCSCLSTTVVRAFCSPDTARAPYYAGDKLSTRLRPRKWLYHNLSPSRMGILPTRNNISNKSKFDVGSRMYTLMPMFLSCQ